jgi:hypothetical protein
METRHKKRMIAAFFLLTLALSSFVMVKSVRESIRELIEENLRTLRTNYGVEKVYVHLDKPYYVAGETLWLKAYIRDAASLQATERSDVVYVDLTDASGKPAKQLTLKATRGQAAGDIALPDSLPGGKYRLTAYTSWMRNFGENSFFTKEIHIWNPADTAAASPNATLADGKMDLQFFPEGGHLVAGLPGQVAFKAIDSLGLSMPVKAALFDQEGRKILDFTSEHLGMGAFSFTPEANKRYYAKVNFRNGITLDYLLPEALPQGYTLSVDELSRPDSIAVRVQTNVPDARPLLLTAIAQDRLIFSRQVVWEDNEYRVNVARDAFPTGVVRFTLAQPMSEPYAERLTFVNNQDQLTLNVRTDRKIYGTREKVTLQIEANNAAGEPVSTDFSLAVTDDELVTPAPNGLSIQSYLLLTSDLKGFVEQPEYYFAEATPERQRALSYLMMTQGWRRFTWQQIVAGDFPQIQFPAETDLTIRGKLVTSKGKPVAGGEVILYLKDQHETFIVGETNQNGEFAFEGFSFTDSVSLVIQGTDARGRREPVVVQMHTRDLVPAAPQALVPGADQLLASTRREYIDASAQQIQAVDEAQSYTLGDIVLKDIVIENRAKIVEPFRLHNRADVSLRADQLPVPPSGNILEVLQGRVAGLQVYRTGPNDFRAVIRGQGQPLYLVDGVPVHESAVNMLSPFDIETIEVLKNVADAGIYGGRAAGGVIAFFTKRGTTSYEEVDISDKRFIIIHRAAGFARTREFYSPKYEAKAAKKEPDYRTTVYWNPMVRTDASGKAEVSFYTTDRTTRYRAILEGISDEGKPGRQEHTFGTDNRQAAR